MTEDDLYTVIETALSFDSGQLYDIDHLQKQLEVETRYERAAQLYFRNEVDEAEQYLDEAYEAAEELSGMVTDHRWDWAYTETVEKMEDNPYTSHFFRE